MNTAQAQPGDAGTTRQATPIDQESLSQLIGLAYECASHPEVEADFLHAVCTALGLDSATVILVDLKQRTNTMLSMYVDDPGVSKETLAALVADYNRRFSQFNPLTEICIDKGLLVSGNTIFSEDMVPHPMLQRTAFYNEFFQQQGWYDHAGIVSIADGKTAVTINFASKAETYPFTPAARKLLRMLAGHLARAHTLRRQLETRRVTRDAALQSLDALTFGLLILDHKRKVLFQNRPAREIIDSNKALDIRRRELRCDLPRSQKLLKDQVSMAIDAALHGIPMHWSPTQLDLQDTGQRPVAVCAYPLPTSGSPFAAAHPACLLFLRDLNAEQGLPEDQLIDMFELTPAEARIAQEIANGYSLEHAAERMGHTLGTSRTMLKRVYAKTGTNRQNELACLVMSLAGLLHPVSE